MANLYAMTDLHGCYKLWEKAKLFFKKDDLIYYLGDALDRGPQSIQLFYALMEDSKVIFLKGNHEDLFYKEALKALEFCKSCSFSIEDYFYSIPDNFWFLNGGDQTFEQMNLNNFMYIFNAIKNMPNSINIINKNKQILMLSHAGTHPTYTQKELLKVEKFAGGPPLLWDREHILRNWPDDEKYKNTYIIHGHTPVYYAKKMLYNPFLNQYDCEEDNGIIKYCNGHKFNLDMMSWETHMCVIFNLNTLKVEQIIKE